MLFHQPVHFLYALKLKGKCAVWLDCDTIILT